MAEPSQSRKAPQAPDERLVNAPAGVEADDDLSVYDEAAQSDTTSLASSVLNYEYENGRRYHAYSSGKYIMPNDEKEQERLDMVNHIFLLLLKGELHLAPLEHPEAILDLGTGTGIWAIDIADKFPGARVIGNDLSAIQPSWVPPNLEFVVDDFENDWIYPPNYFDYIHARTLSGSVWDYPKLLQQAYHHLRPGGYFEALEFPVWGWSDDDTLKEDSVYMDYLRNLHEAGRRSGQDLDLAPKLKDWMTAAGFEDVNQRVYFLPFGPWTKDKKLKELGKWQYLQAPEGVEAYGLRLYTQVLGWDTNTAKIHIALVRQQLLDKSIHSYGKLYVVYGRKPQAEST